MPTIRLSNKCQVCWPSSPASFGVPGLRKSPTWHPHPLYAVIKANLHAFFGPDFLKYFFRLHEPNAEVFAIHITYGNWLRFGDLTALIMKIPIFWNTTPCSFVKGHHKRFVAIFRGYLKQCAEGDIWTNKRWSKSGYHSDKVTYVKVQGKVVPL